MLQKKFGMTHKLLQSSMIYYSHVNEDNRVERELFLGSEADLLVAVAGSGERIIALLDNDRCNQFHAVDVNKEALFLLQLKLAALETLSVEDYLQFISHDENRPIARRYWFDMMKDQLEQECKTFWEQRMPLIENGILYAGHFEKFLRRVRPSTNFFLGKNFKSIFSGKKGHFPSVKWNMLKWVFSWQWIYRAWGNKDGAFVGKGADTAQIPNALDQIFRNNEAPTCLMAHLIFKGHLRDMREEDLPPSLQKKILEKIKYRLVSGDINMSYHANDILTYVRTHSHENNQVFYSLSDLLSFEDYAYLGELLACLDNDEDMVVWRSFLKHREEKQLLYPILDRLIDHSESESTRMYKVFSLENAVTV